MDPSPLTPGSVRSDTQDPQEAPLQPENRSLLKTVLRIVLCTLAYIGLYTTIAAGFAGASYAAAHWVLRLIVSRWPSLDPSGSFQAVDPSNAFAAVQASSNPVYFFRALIRVLPVVVAFREIRADPRGRVLAPIDEWWARKTSFMPSVIFEIFYIALLFAVGPLAAFYPPAQREQWLDVPHTTVVAAVVCVWYTTLSLLFWRWRSRKQAIQLTDEQDLQADEMEKGREGVEAPADGPKFGRIHIVLIALVAIPCITYVMVQYNANLNVLAHWLLFRITNLPWLAFMDSAETFQTGTLATTMWTSRLGTFAVILPSTVLTFLPMFLTMDEIMAKNNFEPVKEWWPRVTKPVPRAIRVAFKPALWISTGPIGVWLSRYWPNGEEPGLDLCNATRVAVVAWVLMTIWEKMIASLLSGMKKPVAKVVQDKEEAVKTEDSTDEKVPVESI